MHATRDASTPDASTSDSRHDPASQVDIARTFTLPTDSFDCPDCGRTVVPTVDHLPDLRVEHQCPVPGAQGEPADQPGR